MTSTVSPISKAITRESLKERVGGWPAPDQLEAWRRIVEMEYVIARIYHAANNGGMDVAVQQAVVWAEENL